MTKELNEVDTRRLDVINRVASKPGLRGKIDAKCCECLYDPYAAGSWRKQVELCTSISCPLYDVRTKSKQVNPH